MPCKHADFCSFPTYAWFSKAERERSIDSMVIICMRLRQGDRLLSSQTDGLVFFAQSQSTEKYLLFLEPRCLSQKDTSLLKCHIIVQCASFVNIVDIWYCLRPEHEDPFGSSWCHNKYNGFAAVMRRFILSKNRIQNFCSSDSRTDVGSSSKKYTAVACVCRLCIRHDGDVPIFQGLFFPLLPVGSYCTDFFNLGSPPRY